MEPLTVEERDARTIFMRQIARQAREIDLENFFIKIGKIRDIRMITDRNSHRNKGMCYVEFQNIEAVGHAIRMTGERLCGQPVIIQATMAEKNRSAMEAAAMAKQYGPTKLYVGGLHPDITESMLRAIFEPFGAIDSVQLQYDSASGESKGFGFVHFKDNESARHAAEKLNGFDLAGKTMKVCHVNEKADFNFLIPDEYTSRTSFNSSTTEKPAITYPSVAMRQEPPSCCMVISNAFDSFIDRHPGWEKDLEKEIRDSVSQIGTIRHFFIDKNGVENDMLSNYPSNKKIDSLNEEGNTIKMNSSEQVNEKNTLSLSGMIQPPLSNKKYPNKEIDQDHSITKSSSSGYAASTTHSRNSHSNSESLTTESENSIRRKRNAESSKNCREKKRMEEIRNYDILRNLGNEKSKLHKEVESLRGMLQHSISTLAFMNRILPEDMKILIDEPDQRLFDDNFDPEKN